MSNVRSFYVGAKFESQSSIGLWLRRAVNLISSAVEQRMAEHDLTDAQWKPMLALHSYGIETAADLSRYTHCDTGAITRMVDRLEAKGLVQRKRSVEDRRVVKLELTQEGTRTAKVIPYVLSEILNAHLAGFTQAEHDTLVALLQRIVANGERLGGKVEGGDEPGELALAEETFAQHRKAVKQNSSTK